MWIVWWVGCGSAPQPSEEALPPCADRNPQRNLYWGDLHVHTALSFDAWIYDVRTTPEEAYAFAKGDPIGLPPLGPDGRGTTMVQLERPLDFAAVTDHSEYLGEVQGCTTEGSPVYDLQRCVDYRAATPRSIQDWGTAFVPDDPHRFADLCEVIDCVRDAQPIWERLVAAAVAATDPSEACTFAGMIGYEWSATPGVSNNHRNVLFRTDSVPPVAVSTFDAPTPDALWTMLDSFCDQTRGCEALAIPHNANQSNGWLFPRSFASVEAAERRRDQEPVVEIFQHKGESECRNGIAGIPGAPDELCDFEKLRGPEPATDCGPYGGAMGMANAGCVHQSDFLRGSLLMGLEIEQELGVNPYAHGVIASTDSHNGTPGLVREQDWPGHLGLIEGTPEDRLVEPGLNPGGVRNNPGGLVAIWSPQNRREDLFDSLLRKEVYGTSGPRMTVRFFGGDLPADLCDRSDFVSVADSQGVPMGGQLSSDEAPTFAVSALQDPGTQTDPGRGLQAIQLVKGWVDGAGMSQTQVYSLHDEPLGGVGDDCTPDDSGAASLCAVWTDPDWDPQDNAYYYVRVLEQPTCRWSAWDCLTYSEAERPAVCSDETVAWTVQERAWTSPIFAGPG